MNFYKARGTLQITGSSKTETFLLSHVTVIVLPSISVLKFTYLFRGYADDFWAPKSAIESKYVNLDFTYFSHPLKETQRLEIQFLNFFIHRCRCTSVLQSELWKKGPGWQWWVKIVEHVELHVCNFHYHFLLTTGNHAKTSLLLHKIVKDFMNFCWLASTCSSGWQWFGVVVCGISYYMGITRALFLITPPVLSSACQVTICFSRQIIPDVFVLVIHTFYIFIYFNIVYCLHL